MTAVDIEPPDPGEAETLAELWVALAKSQRDYDSHLVAAPNRTRVRELLARYAATDRLLVARSVATSGDEAVPETDIAGFVMFRKRTDEYETDAERGLIENLYVVPASRGDGVGSALLSAAERRLCERGVEAVSLEAMAGNHAARRFYRRHGYETHRVEFEKSVDEH